MATKWQVWLIGAAFMATIPASVRAQQAARTDNGAQAEETQSSSSPAAEQSGQAEQAGRPRNRLNLTPDQRKQMKAIREARKSQFEAVESDASLTSDQRQEKMREIKRSSHKQIRALLTPEQRGTWREIASERREARARGAAAPTNQAAAAEPSNPASPQ
ncbi:MAG TPA: hypothetical protein VMJ93_05575 [Verrucomicrobiae bacterium]|nr:hypothetical protein [Verrucomicrobiae bacterium]